MLSACVAAREGREGAGGGRASVASRQEGRRAAPPHAKRCRRRRRHNRPLGCSLHGRLRSVQLQVQGEAWGTDTEAGEKRKITPKWVRTGAGLADSLAHGWLLAAAG